MKRRFIDPDKQPRPMREVEALCFQNSRRIDAIADDLLRVAKNDTVLDKLHKIKELAITNMVAIDYPGFERRP